MSGATVSPELLEIIEALPIHPRSADILGALLRAEQAGHARALAEVREGIESMLRPNTENGERWDEGFRKGFERGAGDARQVARVLAGAEIPQGYPQEFGRRIPALARRLVRVGDVEVARPS